MKKYGAPLYGFLFIVFLIFVAIYLWDKQIKHEDIREGADWQERLLTSKINEERKLCLNSNDPTKKQLACQNLERLLSLSTRKLPDFPIQKY